MEILKALRTNQVIAIILFVFSIAYLVVAFQIPDYALPRPVDSDLFPKVLGFLMMILSVGLFFERDQVDEREQLRAKEEEKVEEQKLPFWSRPNVQIVVTVVAVGAYILLLERAGFVLTTLAFVFGMTWFYGYRRHGVNLAVAGVMGFGFYFILTRGLGVYLPPGLLPF